ncbi:MAG: matrixin family metalloprotease [Candidatus Paceibacterota bacterium]|jgi:hypothetical protein
MFKFIKTIFFVLILGIVFILFRGSFENVWRQINGKYLPCRVPIKYSLGTFDEQFGISKEEFLRSVKTAENIWEDSIGRDLFNYDPEGKLKINLIYDIRQEATTKLNDMGIAVGDDKESYENLKSKYNTLQQKYNSQKEILEKAVKLFQEKQDKYEKEVISLNEKGGADEETFNRLNEEKEVLEKEVVNIKKKQAELNKISDEINALVVVINRLIASLNIQVEDLNAIGRELGEFEEGTYQNSWEGEKIEIYQFDNKTKLIRVLAHEFGHALGLGHVDDPDAIMYRLNNGINEKLTAEDMKALRKHCGLDY